MYNYIIMIDIYPDPWNKPCRSLEAIELNKLFSKAREPQPGLESCRSAYHSWYIQFGFPMAWKSLYSFNWYFVVISYTYIYTHIYIFIYSIYIYQSIYLFSYLYIYITLITGVRDSFITGTGPCWNFKQMGSWLRVHLFQRVRVPDGEVMPWMMSVPKYWRAAAGGPAKKRPMPSEIQRIPSGYFT